MAPPGPIGIIANPASGKDVRRLIARASVIDNAEKRAIVRRALAGVAATSAAAALAYYDDPHGIVRGGIADSGHFADAVPVPVSTTGSALDTEAAAGELRRLGCVALVTLGGDGTNRVVTRAWPDAPLIPISTGTNNVFPHFLEATVAGAAAGLISSGLVGLAETARRHKRIHVDLDADSDLALVDAVLSEERFVGSRALLEPDLLRRILLTRAEPAAVGMTAVGGLLMPLGSDEGAGALLELGSGQGSVTLTVPIAPGHYRPVQVRAWRRVSFGEIIEFRGPGVLAFDGERERVLPPSAGARLTVSRDGPWVVDVHRALALGAERSGFRRDQLTHSVSS
ncbi:MAG: ATP-NAD kinase [Gammaproteobacteria bacterium]|nr:ATP-NAD kinase [Gammaproteobacteria bacterium]|tara:strand:+ start:3073 stop:4092 length:1020 start_codon:yes stop_codon:yes gene_type:complete